ncbi:MAG: hypothetical protein GY791_10035 [Alphaproteobacteria bacterium]|nr:hypothetical protein [Alphaproteobacteria bacterium]
MRDFIRDRSGAAIVHASFVILLLLGATALAFDIGRMTVLRTEMQNRADGGAMGGAVSLDGAIFTGLVADVQRILPTASAANLTVRYEPSGLGDPDSPASIIPMLNVSLTGLRHEFIVMGFIEGIAGGIDLPRVEATTVSNAVEGGSQAGAGTSWFCGLLTNKR